MKKIDNLQLLYTLLEVYSSQNLSEAGKKLGKTTSSVSKDISKLREQLDDPLFVRAGNRMLATNYVKCIAPEIDEALNSIRHTLITRKVASNQSHRKSIKIAITQIFMELYSENILLKLSKLFPKSRIELLTWDSRANQLLQDEQIDFGIHSNLLQHPGKIRYKRITENELVVICPKEDADKSLVQITQQRNFIYLRLKDWNDLNSHLFEIANEHGIFPNYALVVDNLNLAMKIAEREKLCFLVPRVIADYYRSSYISWELPTKGMVIGLYYHALQDEALTRMIYDIISDVIINFDVIDSPPLFANST
ncbi:transcriptional regulator [Vibrio mediterranei]|uniref:Transcriptional regulator n=1 Tax=Vibrio mediterranei TaxID=689 RepID=A0AAN1KR69_9VIBR|nr:transcriptional regulator [Vibrio mediterranei]